MERYFAVKFIPCSHMCAASRYTVPLYGDRARSGNIKLMSIAELVELDVIGEKCPMPLLKAKRALNGMVKGQQLKVLATDSGSVRDFHVFAQHSGNILLSSHEENGVYIHLLVKS